MTLDEIVGTDGMNEIIAKGSITFHAVGDTGSPDTMTQVIADVMTKDYNIADPGSCPAFLFHLGDVIYYMNNDAGYLQQFYVPYKAYPGKIIAIPGNHDGEMFKYDQPGNPRTFQTTTLEAFQKNFCQDATGVPTSSAGTIYREMIAQPAVYWYLNAPFVDIVALYSNVAEGPGYIADHKKVGQSQKDWLAQTLQTIAAARATKRKALIIAVHHPPYSGGGHASSVQMLADIDACCKLAGIMPDAVISGHSHNYQRFTRNYALGGVNMQIPYFVAGSSGHGLQPVPQATGQKNGDATFESSLEGFGFLTVTVDNTSVIVKFTQVQPNGSSAQFDKTITVDLATSQITAG
jgi:predicted phosphodiesterase